MQRQIETIVSAALHSRQVRHVRQKPAWAGLLAASCLLSQLAHAVILEDIRVKSHLGQPFRAQIAFQAESDDQVDSSCVRVLPIEQSTASLPFSNTRIQVESRGNGQGRIRLSTLQGITEPVLRFAVQLNCGGGQLTREYTVLIDPAELAQLVDEPDETPAPINTNRETVVRQPGVSAKPAKQRPPMPPRQAAAQTAQLRIAQTEVPTLQMDSAPMTQGFQLRISETLDPQFLNRPPLSEAERKRRQVLLQTMAADDATADMLRLNNQITSLEKQLSALRQQLDTGNAKSAPSTVSRHPSAPQLAHDSPHNHWPVWVDYLLWMLLLGGMGGVAYLVYLYRARHLADRDLATNVDATDQAPPSQASDDLAQRAAEKAATAHAEGRDVNIEHDDIIIVNDHERWLIEEAQIFLKQGWHDQAISLLAEEVQRNPYQLDIWLMLFEIFQRDNDRAKFAEYAERFETLVKGLPIWRTICDMGRAIDPENPLYLQIG
ncbi:Tfp pilus assembly protein FimV [Chitinivorax tropicus]|uniref:Tfp pilus assembly protein FimV n=1 Tax=Chitinivorax tropicus TaxID=714531 RepID=A0A840MMX4_9PROT|nr:hypothetical protein [Chitinivorax tropicus]MBB5017856.1 Tfp pilus assembly protein FimV [Chitinivorax tropicus]